MARNRSGRWLTPILILFAVAASGMWVFFEMDGAGREDQLVTVREALARERGAADRRAAELKHVKDDIDVLKLRLSPESIATIAAVSDAVEERVCTQARDETRTRQAFEPITAIDAAMLAAPNDFPALKKIPQWQELIDRGNLQSAVEQCASGKGEKSRSGATG